MNTKLFNGLFIGIFFVGLVCSAQADIINDNFNDGDLVGWTQNRGVWDNPGDHILSSADNYGVLWKDSSFGYDQLIQVDAYYDGYVSSMVGGSYSKSATLRLRSDNWEHGYNAIIQKDTIDIYNNHNSVQQLGHHDFSTPLTDDWHTITFSVSGLGNNTNLKLDIDGTPYLNVFDTTGSQHDDGGYIALGSSNHINTRIKYDNFYAENPIVPEPTTLLLLGLGVAGLSKRRRPLK